MKKLLLSFMSIALFAAACTSVDPDDVELPEAGNPTVELIGVTDSDTGVFASNSCEPQTFYVEVAANGSLYTSADGTQLKSWISSSDHFEITYTRDYSLVTVTPVDYNYYGYDLDAELVVKLNNNIGSETYTLSLKQEHPTIGYVTFDEDDLLTPSGETVAVGEYELDHGAGSLVSYSKVYIAKGGEYEVAAGSAYDDVLFTTNDGFFSFGAYFAPNVTNSTDPSEEAGDTWYGFVLSQNYTTGTNDYEPNDQFTAWGTPKSNDDKTFAVASIPKITYTDAAYEEPTINFSDTVILCNIDVTNTAEVYQYSSAASLSADSVLYYNVLFTGALDGAIVGYARGNLIVSETDRIADWTNVDLSTIGGVINSLKISFESNDYFFGYGINVPLYVALDNLTYIKEW